MSWTDERVELLKKLWSDGLSASQIAIELGGFDHTEDAGRSAVIGKVHRLGLSGRTKKPRNDLTQKGIRNKILNAKLRKQKPAPPAGEVPELEAFKNTPIPPEQVEELYSRVKVAKLNGPVLPIHLSAAFPSSKESDLTPGELLALGSLYG